VQDAFFMCRLSSHQSVVSLSVRERKNEEEEKKEEEENKKTSAAAARLQEKKAGKNYFID
jgi:hypothetical protein